MFEVVLVTWLKNNYKDPITACKLAKLKTNLISFAPLVHASPQRVWNQKESRLGNLSEKYLSSVQWGLLYFNSIVV